MCRVLNSFVTFLQPEFDLSYFSVKNVMRNISIIDLESEKTYVNSGWSLPRAFLYIDFFQ